MTSKNRLANAENCVKGQKRLNMTKGTLPVKHVVGCILNIFTLYM